MQEERFRFMEAWQRSGMSFAEVCRLFSVSRKTGYKWLERYEAGGLEALRDQSRAPKRQANEVLPEVTELVVAARRAHPTWGPVKLRAALGREAPEIVWPAESTIGEILKRHGLTASRRRRARATPNAQPLAHALAANDVWCADFKGWFRTQDGSRCDPLTISDACTRYLLRCEAVERTSFEYVQPVFESAFREFGLPAALRTDNGPPFASTALGGLSRLGIWLVRLGVRPERIRPGRPAENGRHERMHRTLKQETARPARATLGAQQAAFDRFRREYNEVRPHAALEQQTPASQYRESKRRLPSRLVEPEYPDVFEVRRVKSGGEIKWQGEKLYVSQNLAGERIGLEPVDDGLWRVWLCGYELGRLDDRTRQVTGVPAVTNRSRSGRPPGSLRASDSDKEEDR